MVQRRRWAIGLRRTLLGGGFAVGLAGCGGAAVAPAGPAEDPTALYWRLTLNQHAINLSTVPPHDTFRLVATPWQLDGAPLATVALVEFTSKDTGAVQVSPDGLVRGLQAAGRVAIIAKLTEGLLTHADTAFVGVAAEPPPITQFSLDAVILNRFTGEALPSDTAKGTIVSSNYYLERTVSIRPRALDVDGNERSNLVVWIESSDPSIARYEHRDDGTPGMDLTDVGSVTWYASMMADGVPWADTLEFTVGQPLFAEIAVEQTQLALGNTVPTYRFAPAKRPVGTGAYVWWLRRAGVPAYDVTFDDPTHVAADTGTILGMPVFELFGGDPNLCGTAGHIPPFDTIPNSGGGGLCSRFFPVAGMYHYHSAALNASGTVDVVDESQRTTELASSSPLPILPTTAFSTGSYRLRLLGDQRPRRLLLRQP